METITLKHGQPGYPTALEQMHKPPSELYTRGAGLEPLMSRPRAAIVGSRRMSPYGRQVTARFARELAERGVVIISGLAMGVDAQAHLSALEAGGTTIAVLPSPVESPLPYANQRLAQRILDNGGALVSTYPIGSDSHKGNFVARNEVVAALSDVIVVTEATARSGTWHTAVFAENMQADVLAVPGPIDSPLSAGTHRLVLSDRAKLAPDVRTVLETLQLQGAAMSFKRRGGSPAEQRLIDLLATGVCDGQELLAASKLPIQTYNQALAMLEINGTAKALGGNQWGLA